jgi:hypothetical protein
MQEQITLNQLKGIKKNSNISENSILNLYEGEVEKFSFKDLEINSTLTNPEYVAGLALVNNFTFFDMKVSYQGDKSVSVISDGDEFLVDFPVDLNQALMGVSMYTGNSALLIADIKANLSHSEFYTFAIVLDYFRQENSPISKKEITFNDELIKEFNENYKATEMSIRSYARLIIDSEEYVLLETLVNQGLLVKNDESYTLGKETLMFMDGFYEIDNYISVEAIAKVSTGFTAIQSGLYRVLYLEETGDEIIIQTLAPAILLEVIQDLMNKNDKMMSLEKTVMKTEEINSNERFCTNCNKPVSEGAKFCGSCGAKI